MLGKLIILHSASSSKLVILILLCLSANSGSLYAGTVTSTADSGPGTLRQVVMDAMPGETIFFDYDATNGVPIVLTVKFNLKTKTWFYR